MYWYKIFDVNLGKNEYTCFGPFKVWFLNFPLKEETMKNILNRNVAELARWIIVFLTQKLGICFFVEEILVCDLFSLGFLIPMLHHLI